MSHCSISRIIDKRHHWWDVLAGVIGGISLAVITVRNYEPYEFEFDILISKPKIYTSFYLRTAKYICT